jgi:hypothetical protein
MYLVGSAEALVHDLLVGHLKLLHGRVVELEPTVLVPVGQRVTAPLLKCPTNGTAHIRHRCRKTTALSCHSYLIKTGVEKMNNI